MAFKIGGFAIDHIVMGTFENSANELLYTLSNLSEATISITSESKDVMNAQGNLVRKIYRGKTGEFSSTSAFIDMNALAAGTGSDIITAAEGATVVMPEIRVVGKGTASVNLTGAISGTIQVMGLAGNGAKVESYALDTTAGEGKFAFDGGVLTLPTAVAEEVVEFVVKCDKDATNGMKVANRSDKFPKAGKLTLKALAIDPCDKDGVIACYIVCPNFQPSPDVEIALSNDGDSTIAYNGTLAVDQCSAEKVLYEIYLFDEEE